MLKPIIVVGTGANAGSHCRVVLSILSYYKECSIVGIADRNLNYKGDNSCGNIIPDLTFYFSKGPKIAVQWCLTRKWNIWSESD